MPFSSQKQRRACWAKYNAANKKGKKPGWDCAEWERAGKRKKKVRMSFRGAKACGAKTLSGKKCRRKTLGKRCYQHN